MPDIYADNINILAHFKISDMRVLTIFKVACGGRNFYGTFGSINPVRLPILPEMAMEVLDKIKSGDLICDVSHSFNTDLEPNFK